MTNPTVQAPEEARARVIRVGEVLKRYFVGKDELINLMVLCTATQEPLLLVGPPGTAKSDLIVKFAQSLSLAPGEYFEYMLTRFTEPSEIFGPIDINQLRDGSYVRRVEGKIPSAKVVFLDEIFKSNSAILNSLLTILNERKYYQDGVAVEAPLVMLFAATNSVAGYEEMDALRDRFILKVESAPVRHGQFEQLVSAGLTNEALRALNQQPWAGIASLDDFLAIRAHLDRQDHEAGGELGLSRWFPPAVFDLFRRILAGLEGEELAVVSDRKVIKLYRLLRTRAYLDHGGEVRPDDLRILAHLGESEEKFALVRERVTQMLRLA